MVLAIAIWMLAESSMAQNISGRNLIFGSEGRVGTGGPTGEQAKEVIKQRIQEQSEGQITLFGFRQIVTRPLDLELNGKATFAVEFEAGVEFVAPCRWASRHLGKPLTFFILKPESNFRSADPRNVIEVKEKGERYVMQGYALFTSATNGWTLAGFGQSSWPIRESVVPDEDSAKCVTQLKQIGLVFQLWAMDNNDHYPFNVSTNAGGTMEFCARGNDGFDASAAIHFQVMSNELGSTTLLVCPSDSTKKPAMDFRTLQATNVTYVMRSGSHFEETNQEEILAKCPIHGHVVLCNGSVKKGTVK